MSQMEPTALDRGHFKQSTTALDGQGLKALLEAGLLWLKANQQTVNALNVFPVPDGDTGTNMLLTMQAAFAEIANSGERNIGRMAHGIAQGALMGARGNSGVILSQLWRGFARALDNLEVMDAATLVRALEESRNTAYKGVVRPVEGTILTVAKDVAAATNNSLSHTDQLDVILDELVQAADISVRNTPELLPILKQAGVVDSGGKGLFYIFEGMLRYINNLPLDTALTSVVPLAAMQLQESMEAVEPGQDFEVVVDFIPNAPLNLDKFYEDLSGMGTSIQLGEGDGMYRIHIHVPTDKRYDPIDYILTLGTMTKVAMENLVAQMDGQQAEEQINPANVEPGQIAVVAVSPGAGISRIFASLGVAAIVEGGQTMNPSTEQILHSFENLPTDQIIILPNNKNIILASQTAKTMTVKNVAIIPTRSVPQGLSALLCLNPEGDMNEIVSEMNAAITEVETGEITVATRSIQINGVNVNQGEVIALLNGQLVAASSNLQEACLVLLDKASTKDRERITLFYGQNITRNEVNQIVDKIREAYPMHEVELHEGGQPHYQFIIAVE